MAEHRIMNYVLVGIATLSLAPLFVVTKQIVVNRKLA